MAKKLIYFILVVGVFAAGAFLKVWSESSTPQPVESLNSEASNASGGPLKLSGTGGASRASGKLQVLQGASVANEADEAQEADEASPAIPIVEKESGSISVPESFAEKNKIAVIKLGGETFTFEIADTRLKQIRGLTRRESIPQNYGMAYVLDAPSRYAYWMKDMLFATDVVWLDAFYRVIDLEKNITPDSYPKIFEPDQPALFVLELASGSAQKAGITLNSTVDLSAIIE